MKSWSTFSRNIRSHINCVSDLIAKKAVFAITDNVKLFKHLISLIFFKAKAKRKSIAKLTRSSTKIKEQKSNTSKFEYHVCMKIINFAIKTTSRVVCSFYTQLKVDHEFFWLYFSKLTAYIFHKCDCDDNHVQSSAHTSLDCEHYESFRLEWRQKITFQIHFQIYFVQKKTLTCYVDFCKKLKLWDENESKQIVKTMSKFIVFNYMLEHFHFLHIISLLSQTFILISFSLSFYFSLYISKRSLNCFH